MGYTIRIGNAEVLDNWEANPPTATWHVPLVARSDAPFFTDSGTTNERAPSYTGWGEFCREVGLDDLMQYNLLAEHPGIAKLKPVHASKIELALEVWKLANPNALPEICQCFRCAGTLYAEHNPNASVTLVRLTWLAYWVRWAVDHCHRPAIQNT